jgi:hypothetical protein
MQETLRICAQKLLKLSTVVFASSIVEIDFYLEELVC